MKKKKEKKRSLTIAVFILLQLVDSLSSVMAVIRNQQLLFILTETVFSFVLHKGNDVALCSLYDVVVVLLHKLRVRAILCVSLVLVSCSGHSTCVF